MQLPLCKYEGETRIVTPEDYQDVVETLLEERVVGFDTETRPAFQRGEKYNPALVQLAGSHIVYLFQLKRLPNLAPLALLFSDPFIVKTGVAVHEDIQKLHQVMDFVPASFIDLAPIAQKAGLTSPGLRNLATHFLGFRVSKGARLSNWEREDLRSRQVAYAATDAWVSREVFLAMEKMGLVGHPHPSPSAR